MRPRCIAISVIAALSLVTHSAGAAEDAAAATLVLFNSAVPESAELAKFYARKRQIPERQVVGLPCSKEEEISREEFDDTLATPLRALLADRGLWTVREAADEPPRVESSRIRFVAVIKGIPLKIRSASDYAGDKVRDGPVGNRNEASVDSELAVLARFSPEISGAVSNAYYKSFRRITDIPDLPLLLVCRLDAPSAETVRRMITDAVSTEKEGLWGRAFVDAAQNTSAGLRVGDRWLEEVVQQLRSAGMPVFYDKRPEVFEPGFPMSDVALYYGWYADRVAGPFAEYGFRFTPGAIAAHIHSFSASTLRTTDANWVAPLLTAGAAASLGNVYEPFLQMTTDLSMFNDRLLHGFTFAESAYAATPALSWMTVMVGDPLYRPFAAWLEIDVQKNAESDWKSARDFAIANATLEPSEFQQRARVHASRIQNAPMLEDLALREFEKGNNASAVKLFGQARAIYRGREDILRMILMEARALGKLGERKRAASLIQSVVRVVSDGPTARLLKAVEAENKPQPSPHGQRR